MVKPHQRYHHGKFVNIQMTVLQRHAKLTTHWLVRESVGGDYKNDSLQEEQDIEERWVLDFDPPEKSFSPASGGSPGADGTGVGT